MENHGVTTFDPRGNKCGADVAAFEAFEALLKRNSRLRASRNQLKSCPESQKTWWQRSMRFSFPATEKHSTYFSAISILISVLISKHTLRSG